MDSFPQVPPRTETQYEPLLSPICTTCTAHLIVPDLITRVTFDNEYKSWSSASCSLVQSVLLRPSLAEDPPSTFGPQASKVQSISTSPFAKVSYLLRLIKHLAVDSRQMDGRLRVSLQPCRCTPLGSEAEGTDTHWTGDWVGPKTFMDRLEGKNKPLPLPRIEHRLYPLSYTSSPWIVAFALPVKTKHTHLIWKTKGGDFDTCLLPWLNESENAVTKVHTEARPYISDIVYVLM